MRRFGRSADEAISVIGSSRRGTKLVAAAVFLFGGATVAAAAQPPSAQPAVAEKESGDVTDAARAFLADYQQRFAELEIRSNLAAWKAANSGQADDYAAAAEASLALRTYHSDAERYRRLKELIGGDSQLTPQERRALELAELTFRANQLPAELLEQMVTRSSEIEQLYSTYRGEFDGRRWSNNDLLERLRSEEDSQVRHALWEALKQIGGVLGTRLRELAELRNEGARQLGFANYWDMQIRLQEHDPQQVLTLFDDLEQLTRQPFTDMKAQLDRELGRRFGLPPEQLMPWHYDNPFFQNAPPSEAVDLDEFYRQRTKEEIVEIARRFYADVGLPADGILQRSDLYEREGKDQHAFCMSVDRAGDVRTLCNVKPTADWMDTVLHELGHGVYDVGVDRSLPYNVREPAHAFTTEGVAMLFGSLPRTPAWMVHYAGADAQRIAQVSEAIAEQRRREQLIFARWTMVMLHFEKALYEDPGRDLNAHWWDCVERFQQLRRPEGRNEPDWAAKPHFTIAPVYYHNYMMGELFAAQLRKSLAAQAGYNGPMWKLDFVGRKDFGRFLTEQVFRPGRLYPWPRFVQEATGEPLSAKYFAAEVQ